MNVRLTAEARLDIKQHALWYRRQDKKLERSFMAALARTLSRLESSPRGAPRIPSHEEFLPREIRNAVFIRLPHFLIYEIVEDEVVVHAEIHHRQSPTTWRQRL